VFAQSPAAGTALTNGQPVTVSVHEACAAVPDLGKLPVAEARSQLAKVGLQIGQVTQGPCVRGLGAFVVVGQDQPPGTVLPLKTSVGVTTTGANCG
jgi:beta-lactam-binding protein with PASTA domain